MKKIIASTLIAVGLIASVGTTANAAAYGYSGVFAEMTLNGN